MQHRVGYGITTPRSSDLKPEQRVVLHIFYCSKFKIMKNLGKVLDYQKKTTDAVEKMMDLLANYYSIGMLYETLANAQMQIMSLLRLCDRYIEDGQKWGEVLNPNDIEDMLLQVNEVYKLLKPFEELARENGGGNVLD